MILKSLFMGPGLLSLLVVFFSFFTAPNLSGKVYEGIIDLKSTPDFFHFGYGYRVIDIPELNFGAMPSLNVYIRNPIITDPLKNYWIEASDPRALMLSSGKIFLAYTVANGRPIFDGHYRVVALSTVVNAFDPVFQIQGPAFVGQLIGSFVVPRGMTLKRVKCQVINPSSTEGMGIRVVRSRGNNTPFVDVLVGEISLNPAQFIAPDATLFSGANENWLEGDIIQILVSRAAAVTTGIMVTPVCEYTP